MVKLNKSGLRLSLVMGLVVLLAACGGRTMVESDLRIKGAPDWVNEGTNVLKKKGGRLFHGVGSAPKMGSESLQVSTADDRARAEVARILTSYMDVVSRDYLSSVSTGDGHQVEQEVTRDIENVTKVNMTGVRIIGRWKHKKNGTIYSLAELDMKHVKDTVKRVENMHPGFRDHFNQKAENLFDSVAEK